MKNKHMIILLLFLFIILNSNSVIGYIKSVEGNYRSLSPDIVFAKYGSGDNLNIKDALPSIPEDNTSLFIILIKNGLYEEKILIDEGFVLLLSESRENTKIIFAEQAWIWKCRNDPSNCSRDECNYSWMNENLKIDPLSLTPIKIFSGKWDPEKFISDNRLLLHYK